jgi:hypothetical protein
VDHVTSRERVCQPRGARIVPIPLPAGFPRAEIREIRLEHNQLKDAWIGAGVGGGLAGALIGSSVPIFHHKQVIYKR